MSLDNSSNDPRQDSLTSKRWCFTLWEPPKSGEKTVLAFLKNNLKHIEAGSWEERISFGGVYFNGRRVIADRELEFPGRIEYFEPKFKIEEAGQFFPQISESNIIYRKNGIIALNKPPGLPSLPSKDQIKLNLRSQLCQLLGNQASIHMPSRLDTSVSGLIVISEDPKLHGGLQRLFENKLISKRYIAMVSKIPPWQTSNINLPIGRDPTWGVLRKIDPVNGKASITKVTQLTSFTLLPWQQEIAILEVYPLTGRTHQIRLHLAASGFPIIGDRFYGGLNADNIDKEYIDTEQLHLVSESVRFKHPITGEAVIIEIPKEVMPHWYSKYI